jgi:para-nitrobenzyl esterase
MTAAECPTIEVESGRIRGAVAPQVAVFRGVPYAAPPCGPRRFRPPEPPLSWRDVRSAAADAALCPQPPARLAALMGDITGEQDEDCLTVTVWAPLPLSERRPVLVWLHGGGYSSGGGALPWYSGERLAREHDIVVVGVNYRLGALGYLWAPPLAPGNMGLADQIAALRWIERNAAAFGGDAGRITVMGQSGGAHSVICLLTVPETRSLVQQAILLSTPFGMRAIDPDVAAEIAARFFAELGLNSGHPETSARLQELPVAALLTAQMAVMKQPLRPAGDPTPAFGPTAVGGLPGGATFDREMLRGVARIAAIFGTTADEMTGFYRQDPRVSGLTAETLPQLARELWGEAWPERLATARRRPGDDIAAFCDAQNANYFSDGMRACATAMADAGRRSWVYRFDWRSPANPRLGACHCIELPFVFGTFEAFARAPMFAGAGEQEIALSAVVRAAFARFIKDGTPGGIGVPEWPPFTRAAPVVLHIDRTPYLERLS